MSQDQSPCKTKVSWPAVPLCSMGLKISKMLLWVLHFLASPFLVFKVQLHRVWWQTPVILSLWKAEAGRSRAWGQHGLHSEFKTSLGNIVSSRLILATQLSQNQNQTNKTHNFNPDSFLWAYLARIPAALAIWRPRHGYAKPLFFWHFHFCIAFLHA